MIHVAMDPALPTGLRRCDLLALIRDDLTDDGILAARAKTGKALLIRWTRPLISVIDRAKGLPPRARRPIIATRHVKAYTSAGFRANWRRLMGRCENAGIEHCQSKDPRSEGHVSVRRRPSGRDREVWTRLAADDGEGLPLGAS